MCASWGPSQAWDIQGAWTDVTESIVGVAGSLAVGLKCHMGGEGAWFVIHAVCMQRPDCNVTCMPADLMLCQTLHVQTLCPRLDVSAIHAIVEGTTSWSLAHVVLFDLCGCLVQVS
jgi:hypothetical protein